MLNDLRRWAAMGATFAMSATATGQQGSKLFLVDFEEYQELTEISDQYASETGATFSIVGDDGLLPIIGEEGSPGVGFIGAGDDNPMSSGSRGLTDPLIDGDLAIPNDIAIDFDPPVTSVRLFAIDIDGTDSVTLRAFDGEREVASDTASVGDAGTGNGVSTEFFVQAESITRVQVEITAEPGGVGWAIDFVTFTRPCEGNGCGPLTEIAQESAPGAGDFDENVLGNLLIYPWLGQASTFYAYNIPEGDSWNGQSLTPVADRSHLLMSATLNGVTLNVVHDRAIPDDPDGGHAEMMIELLGDEDGVTRTVEDDPDDAADVFTGEPGESVFTSAQSWSPCCTDGFALSGFDGAWTAYVQFTSVDGNPDNGVFTGMSEWVAYSADGSEISLALEEGRRVRLVGLPCPADCNGDTILNILDFVCFQLEWQAQSAKGDCDGNGVYNILDFVCFQLAFQNGCGEF